MANTIKPKRTGTSGKVPLTTDLEVGEIAVNMADGILYVRDALGTVKQVGKDVDTSNLLPKAGGTITGDLTVSNNLTANSTTNLNGAVRLGQTSAQAITVNGTTTFNGTTSGLDYNNLDNTPDLTPYATTTYVDNEVSNIDLTPYATTTYVDNEVGNIDLTGYATESYVNSEISANAPNLTNYVHRTWNQTISGTKTFSGSLRNTGEFVEHYTSKGSMHANTLFNPADGTIQQILLAGNISFAGFTNATAGQVITLIIRQPSNTTYSWSNMHPTLCRYAGGNDSLTDLPAARDIMTILYIGGNEYYISIANGFV